MNPYLKTYLLKYPCHELVDEIKFLITVRWEADILSVTHQEPGAHRAGDRSAAWL